MTRALLPFAAALLLGCGQSVAPDVDKAKDPGPRDPGLPAGADCRVQTLASASPSASFEPLPLSDTVCPTAVVWSGPAFATGAVLTVVIVTVSAALTEPSLTVSWAL